MFSRADARIAALKAVETHDIKRLVLFISRHDNRRRHAFASHLDDIALRDTQRLKSAAR